MINKISKTCNKCGVIKKVSEYYGDNKGGTRGYCKTCFRESCNDNKEAYSNKLKREYGLTTTEYNNMWDAQGGKCKICNIAVSNPIRETKGDAKGVVDHCHSEGHVRGILCTNCNAGLGQFKDIPENLMRAMFYLGVHVKCL